MKISFKLLFLIVSSFALTANAQNSVIKGMIRDTKTNLPIAYTSIGVKNKPIGTVADSLGNFSFSPGAIHDLDTVVVGRVGYTSLKQLWADFKKGNGQILLEPNAPILLKEIVVNSEKGKIVSYGRTPAKLYLTPRAYKSMPISDVKGREQATVIDIDENVFLKEINFFLSRSNYNKVVFRINFYAVEDEMPAALLSESDVIYETRSTRGWHNLNLEKYNIHFVGHKKIGIGLQLVDTEIMPNDTVKSTFLVAAYPSPLRKSFYREKSEAAWTAVKSSYLYINVKANKLKGNTNVSTKRNDDLTMVDETLSEDFKKLMLGNHPNFGKKVKVDSATIYYESYGEGTPLILLHGNNESIASFNAQVEVLSKKFKVIAIDTRGQGNSTDLSKSAYRYELFAKDVIAVLDAIGIKKADVLGWSDGGNIGLILAYTYPDRINKLAIFGANLFPGKAAIEESIIELFEQRKVNLEKSITASNFNELRLVNLVLTQPDIKLDQLKNIKAPVLVMAGENDVVKDAHTRLIAQSIGQSKIYIFPRGDHFVPRNQPAEFNKVILDFLQLH